MDGEKQPKQCVERGMGKLEVHNLRDRDTGRDLCWDLATGSQTIGDVLQSVRNIEEFGSSDAEVITMLGNEG